MAKKAAPKTAKKTEKHPGGRPTKYHDGFPQLLLDHFSVDPVITKVERFYYKNGDEKEKEIEVANQLPTIENFCRKHGISKQTLLDWTKAHKEFLDAYTRAKEMQEDIWKQNGLKGLYNAQFAQFIGTNCFGYKNKHDHNVDIPSAPVVNINVVTPEGQDLVSRVLKGERTG